MKIVVAIPHSHTWLWTQTCVTCLKRNPPKANDCEVQIVVVDNSPWSPAIRGIKETILGMDVWCIPNRRSNKFHASALDHVVDSIGCDYLMTLETDVLVLRPDWLQWFRDQMKPTDYAVGMWHHEQFVNPSCTLYRGNVLRKMNYWCKHHPNKDTLRWGPLFMQGQPIANRQPERDYQGWYNDNVTWVEGPFADKRGWPVGTELKEQPSGQLKGPGWYEPGQMLHHWAVQEGYTYTVCPTLTTKRSDNLPLQTLYGSDLMPDPLRQLGANELFGNAEAVHLWGGTRALDIIKHDVTCQFVKSNTPYWLAREARFWREVVPTDVQEHTLDLIRQHGWHITGQGTDHVSDRDRAAAEYVKQCYEAGGVTW